MILKDKYKTIGGIIWLIMILIFAVAQGFIHYGIFLKTLNFIIVIVPIAYLIICAIPQSKRTTHIYDNDTSNISEHFEKEYSIFTDMYTTLKDSNVHKLVGIKNKSAKTIYIKIVTLIVFVFLSIILIMVTQKAEHFFQPVILLLMIADGSAFAFYTFRPNTDFPQLYHDVIFPQFIQQIDDNLHYLYTNNSTDQLSKNPELIKVLPHYLKSEFDSKQSLPTLNGSYIWGKTKNDINIVISNIIVKDIINSYQNIIFDGIFAIVDSVTTPVDFKILTNNTILQDRSTKIILDSSHFENFFDIYSIDKNYIYRLLTSEVMEFLLDFYIRYNMPFEISYKNQYLYLRFPHEKALDECDYDSIYNSNMFLRSYLIIDFIEKLSSILAKNIAEIEK